MRHADSDKNWLIKKKENKKKAGSQQHINASKCFYFYAFKWFHFRLYFTNIFYIIFSSISALCSYLLVHTKTNKQKNISLHLILWSRIAQYFSRLRAFERRSLMWCYTYMNALIAFLIVSWLNWRQNFVCSEFLARIIYDEDIEPYICVKLKSMRHEHSDGWQDRKVCFADI